MKTTKAQPKKGWNKSLVVIVIFVTIFLIFGGESSKLTCKHNRQLETADCIKQSVLLWVIPLSTTTITDISGSQVSETSGYDDGVVYRVELITQQGIAPLTTLYTSGYSTKSNVVDQINAYVHSKGDETLVVNEPGMLSLENVICMVIWFPIAYLASIIFGEVKAVFGGGKQQS